MKLVICLVMVLLAISAAHADAGMNDGETILDTQPLYDTASYMDGTENGASYISQGVLGQKVSSILQDTFTTQFENKEQAQNQNVELDVAKANLENSKDNVSKMFFFIVATFVVLFDAIISIIYIFSTLLLIWLLFVGYIKFHIMIIDMIYGQVRKRRTK